jgi:hypothetical protein
MKFVFAAFALVTLAACHDAIEPLSLGITASAQNPSAAVGDTVAFAVDAEGQNLTGLEADFGDGTTDAFDLSFARTAHVTFKHVYATAGNYTATFEVADVTEATKNATAAVQIH